MGSRSCGNVVRTGVGSGQYSIIQADDAGGLVATLIRIIITLTLLANAGFKDGQQYGDCAGRINSSNIAPSSCSLVFGDHRLCGGIDIAGWCMVGRRVVDGNAAGDTAAERRDVEGHAIDGHTVDSRCVDGRAINGDTVHWDTTDGDATDGDTVGRHAVGRDVARHMIDGFQGQTLLGASEAGSSVGVGALNSGKFIEALCDATLGAFNLDDLASRTPAALDVVVGFGTMDVDFGLGNIELIVRETGVAVEALATVAFDPEICKCLHTWRGRVK